MDDEYINLIDKLVISKHIKSPEIERVFREYNRAEFLSNEQKPFVGEDAPLPIGHNQTISQPYTVAFILDLLDIHRGNNILDVGTGSGWQAALLAGLVIPEGRVITVERIQALADIAKANLEKFGLITSGIVTAVCGNALKIDLDWPVFDRIVSAAEYTPTTNEGIPESWKNALAIGGRIVMPVAGRLIVADKISGTEFTIKEYPGFSFVPLIP